MESSYRPIGTGMRQATGYNGGLQNNIGGLGTNIKLTDRPVTQQGLTGMRTANKGPQRSIYDRTYFLNRLKAKNKELSNEIERFKTETDKIQKDHELYSKLEQKYEDLSKEVRELEGSLADYNLAFDKERAGTKPEEISSIIVHLKNQTSRFRGQLDEIFIERKDQESQIQKIEQQLKQLQEMAIIKMNELDEQQKKEYLSLKGKNREVEADIGRARREMEELNYKVAELDKKLRVDHTRMKVINLKTQITELEAKKEDLAVQCNEANMSVPELRERLLQKMKDDRDKITKTEARTRDLRRAVEQMRRRLIDLEEEIGGNAQITEENKQKYEAIYKKEKEIDAFMEKFQGMREKELTEISSKQQTVLQYMENISHSINLMRRAPDAKDYENIRQHLNMQNQQTQDAEATLRLVKSQLSNRMSDLEKLKNIGNTIPLKLAKLKEQKEHMKKELIRFQDVDQVIEKMTERRQKLSRRTQEMINMSDRLTEEHRNVKAEFDEKKRALQAHPSHGSFSQLESKIAQNESLINNMKSYIANRSQDMNLDPILKKCGGIADEINDMICVKK